MAVEMCGSRLGKVGVRASIGLPFSDQAAVLDQAIVSILQQDAQDWELILLADGASEEALVVANKFDDERIRLIVGSEREGLAARLNQIAQLARGDIVIRMDADDIMCPHRVSTQVTYLEENSSVDIVGSRAYLINERNEVQGGYREPVLPRTPADYLRNGNLTHPTVAGRKSWFLENPYNEALGRAQDKELWMRTGMQSNFAKLPERLLFYRVNSRISVDARRISSDYNKMIVREHGPALVGDKLTRRYLRRARLQDLLFETVGRTARANTLAYERKIERLTAEELALATEMLSTATRECQLA